MGRPTELVQVLSRGSAIYPNYNKEDLYWETLESARGYKLEFNKTNQIYRVINDRNQPLHASYIEREMRTYFDRVKIIDTNPARRLIFMVFLLLFIGNFRYS